MPGVTKAAFIVGGEHGMGVMSLSCGGQVERQSLNAMCRLAEGAKDYETARAFLKRIGEPWDQSVWRTRQNFDRMKKIIEEG